MTLTQFRDALKALSGALPFDPVLFADVMAQRYDVEGLLEQLKNLGETSCESALASYFTRISHPHSPKITGTLEDTDKITTLQLDLLATDPDFQDCLRKIQINVLEESQNPTTAELERSRSAKIVTTDLIGK